MAVHSEKRMLNMSQQPQPFNERLISWGNMSLNNPFESLFDRYYKAKIGEVMGERYEVTEASTVISRGIHPNSHTVAFLEHCLRALGIRVFLFTAC